MTKKTEIRITKTVKNGFTFLLYQKSDDNFLTQLTKYLFEHRLHISSILEVLQSATITEYRGDMMHSKLNGTSIIIYDYYHEEPEKYKIEINRSDLIEIFIAWQEIDQFARFRNGISGIILQRDNEHITMITNYEDKSELIRIFNYKVQRGFLKFINNLMHY